MKFKINFSIFNFKLFVKKFVTTFSSREFAFLYALLGTIGQIFHTYYLIYSVSSFDGWLRTLQAIMLSIFISSALMYFVSIADKDDDDPKEFKRIMRAVNLFMYIEILINLYYYCNHLIIKSPEMRIFDFVFGSMVSALIPISIKLFANSIKAKQWLREIEDKENKAQTRSTIKNDPLSDQLIDDIFNELQNRVENHIKRKIQTIDEHVQLALKEKLKDENLDNLIGNYSIDHELIKSNLKSDLKEYIDRNIKLKTVSSEISVEDIDKLYHDDIAIKIEELVNKNHGEFLLKIENKIENAIKNYMNKNSIK